MPAQVIDNIIEPTIFAPTKCQPKNALKWQRDANSPVSPIVPYKTLAHGRDRWCVTVPRLIAGKRKRKFFATEKEAIAEAEQLERDRVSMAAGFHRLTSEEQGSVIRSLERVEWNVHDLARAVDNLLRSRPQKDIAVDDAVADFLRTKKEAGIRPRYLEVITLRLRQFRAAFPYRHLSDIQTTEIESWLNGLGWAPATRRSMLIDLRTFFGVAVKRLWVASNPVLSIEAPILDDKPPGILTPDQCAKLLVGCRKECPALLPYVVLQLFGGLRPHEAKQIAWSDVSEDHIVISGRKAKTRARRLVTVSATLRAWLALKGELPPMNARNRLIRVRGKMPWPHDCLRHSFVSYHYAQHRNAALTAAEAGHCESVLFRHYRELVTKSDAEKFWSLRP